MFVPYKDTQNPLEGAQMALIRSLFSKNCFLKCSNAHYF